MAALRQFSEPAFDDEFEPGTDTRQPAPILLANAMSEPRPSPVRILQDELRRALNPGPIVEDRFSTRRALQFIAPTWLSLWGFIALLGHLGHH